MTDATTTSPNTRAASRGSKWKGYSDDDLKDHLRCLVSIGQLAGSMYRRVACPLCNSSGPDLQLYHDQDRFRCFRCKKSGDIIGWVMAEDNVDYKTAIRKLANIAGVTLAPPKARLETLSKAMDIYRENLKDNRRAQAFLESRGLEPRTWFNANIGYASGTPEGIPLKELADVGLYLLHTENPRPFYENRIIFAVHNRKGEIVHMQGRCLNGSEPKYMQLSGDTNLGQFPIGAYLYGEELLNNPSDDAFILEGIPDTLTVRQYGLYGFGILGNQGFVRHASKLSRSKRIYVILDNDQASRRLAIEQLIELQLRLPHVQVFDVVLPKKPDQPKQDVNSWYLEEGRPSREVFWEMVRACRRPVLEAALTEWGPDLSRHERLVEMVAGSSHPALWLQRLADLCGEPLSSLMYLARIVEAKRGDYSAA